MLLAMFGQIFGTPIAYAANGTWLGSGSDGLWSDSSDWLNGIIPGALSGTTDADVATFNTNPTQTTITIDSGRNIGGLTFDGSAGAFTIGGLGANLGNSLLLSSGGTIQLGTTATSFTGSGITETINCAAGP